MENPVLFFFSECILHEFRQRNLSKVEMCLEQGRLFLTLLQLYNVLFYFHKTVQDRSLNDTQQKYEI